MANTRDFTGKNRKFTGTKGIVAPKGTTGQRVGSESGELRFNSTTNLLEYYTGTEWKSIDAPPTITNFSVNGGGNVTSTFFTPDSSILTVAINGSLFDVTGGTVLFVGTGGGDVSPITTTRTSSNLFTITVNSNSFSNTFEPYDLKVTNGSGLSATLENCINSDAAPAFVTASGNIGSVWNGRVISGSTLNCSATDADGDTITYSITSGSLPGTGLSLSSSTGYITGTLGSNPTQQDYTFTVSAATTSQTTTRSFTLTVSAAPSGGTITTTGGNTYHVFTSSGNLVLPAAFGPMQALLVGGGGGGGHWVGAGGGGGGMVDFPSAAAYTIPAGTHPVTVGAGAPGDTGPSDGASGGDSYFTVSGTNILTAIGGGSGGSYTRNANNSGGNGGGRGNDSNANGTGVQTTATTSPLGNSVSANSRTYGFGYAGGSTSSPEGYGQHGGGGCSGVQEGGGNGQDGRNVSWASFLNIGTNSGNSGSSGGYFGGGGGCGHHSGGGVGTGGVGGGATGNSNTPSKAANGLANTGGGGGGNGLPGGSGGEGGNGGTGVVIISYPS
jgi:hypothetical protein